MFASTAGNNTGQSQALLAAAGHAGLRAGKPDAAVAAPAVPGVTGRLPGERGTSPRSTFVNRLRHRCSATCETGYVKAWNIGVQRQIAKNTVIEVRYLGNRADKLWHTFSLNEVNIFENGFLDGVQERAERTSRSTKRTGSRASRTRARRARSPLPIFDAAFGARGSQPALPGQSGVHQRQLHIGSAKGRSRPARRPSRRRARRTSAAWSGNTFIPC